MRLAEVGSNPRQCELFRASSSMLGASNQERLGFLLFEPAQSRQSRPESRGTPVADSSETSVIKWRLAP